MGTGERRRLAELLPPRRQSRSWWLSWLCTRCETIALVLDVFHPRARELIVLAEDEARMLGRPVVEPEHLLLALTRCGTVRWLFAECGVSGSDVHAAIVRASGVGDDLVLGAVPRSSATDAVLERAVDLAAERGELDPGGEHLLLALALAGCGNVRTILGELGIDDAVTLVDSASPARPPPISAEQLKQHLVRVGVRSGTWRPDPIAPMFERYTAEAQRAIRAACEAAALLEHLYVQPLHLLLGCLHVPDSLAARVLDAELAPSDMGTLGEAMERARMYGPNPAHQATGIFTARARRIVAQDAFSYAYRHDHLSIGTGHLLLATLDAEDRAIDRIVGSGLMGSGPVHDRLARALTRALPGDEHPTDRVLDGEVICFDVLIRMLTAEFTRIAPPGWELHGSARSGGVRLKVPDSRSEEDFAVHLEWIVAEDGPARDRLVRATHRALQDLQAAIVEHDRRPWPGDRSSGQPERSEVHAEIVGDHVNPMLRLWYGDPDKPTLEVTSTPIYLTSVIHDLR
jgi:Clp amino terminal domain, pathogenicity island component